MDNVELLEQIAETIACNGPTGLQYPWHTKAARAILPIILAAREEGARAMQEACAQDAATWFPAGSEGRYPTSGVVASIRALDPAQIAGGSDAEAD